MTGPVIPFDPPAPQLSAEQLRQIDSARQAAARIRKAVRVARFDSVTIGFFGALTILCGFVGGFSTVLAGLITVFIAIVEWRGADGLARLKVESIKMLTWNQIALASMIVLYSLWGIYGAMTAKPDPQTASELAAINQVGAQYGITVDAGALGSFGDMTSAFYAVVIVLTLLCQGGLALYYFRRKVNLTEFLSETPPWILAMLNAGMSL